MILQMHEEKNMYCPICGKEIEKYGRRKKDLKKSGWMFCPIHGWLQYEQHEEHLADLSDKTDQKTVDSEHEETKEIGPKTKKSTPIVGLIISVTVVTAFLGLILGYFPWKKTENENFEIKSSKIPVLVEKSGNQMQFQTPVLPKEVESGIESQETQKEIKDKTPQLLKSSKTIFTVQVGAFSDFFHAQALKRRLVYKGYNVYITPSGSKKTGILYKVCVGKFSDKEKVESLSVKINKTEHLQTFVTSN
jgi:cell division protein FtsN